MTDIYHIDTTGNNYILRLGKIMNIFNLLEQISTNFSEDNLHYAFHNMRYKVVQKLESYYTNNRRAGIYSGK